MLWESGPGGGRGEEREREREEERKINEKQDCKAEAKQVEREIKTETKAQSQCREQDSWMAGLYVGGLASAIKLPCCFKFGILCTFVIDLLLPKRRAALPTFPTASVAGVTGFSGLGMCSTFHRKQMTRTLHLYVLNLS